MTAAEQGALWGASVARAAFAGDAAKLRRARDEAVAAWPAPCCGDWWSGHDAAYRAAWWRRGRWQLGCTEPAARRYAPAGTENALGDDRMMPREARLEGTAEA